MEASFILGKITTRTTTKLKSYFKLLIQTYSYFLQLFRNIFIKKWGIYKASYEIFNITNYLLN